MLAPFSNSRASPECREDGTAFPGGDPDPQHSPLWAQQRGRGHPGAASRHCRIPEKQGNPEIIFLKNRDSRGGGGREGVKAGSRRRERSRRMETSRSGARQRLRAEPSGSRRAGLSSTGTGSTGTPAPNGTGTVRAPPAAGPGRGQRPEPPRPRRSRMEARRDGWKEGWSGRSGGGSREQGPGTVRRRRRKKGLGGAGEAHKTGGNGGKYTLKNQPNKPHQINKRRKQTSPTPSALCAK